MGRVYITESARADQEGKQVNVKQQFMSSYLDSGLGNVHCSRLGLVIQDLE